jgi:hypothetical protein
MPHISVFREPRVLSPLRCTVMRNAMTDPRTPCPLLSATAISYKTQEGGEKEEAGGGFDGHYLIPEVRDPNDGG